MEDNHLLHHPFIPNTITSTTKKQNDYTDIINVLDTNIVSRFVLILFVAIISIWANYQASKGFEIFIINDVKDTVSGKNFHLLFVSNDKITQIVLSTSKIAETVLYPDDRKPTKLVTHVTVRLTNKTMTHQHVVVNTKGRHEYVLHITSSLMEEKNVEKAVVLAVQRGMTRVWLWNREDGAPDELIDGIVEFVNVVAGLVELPDYRLKRLPVVDNMCWKYGDQMDMAHFLSYCETMKNGFIGRLNQAMENSWNDSMVDDALGMPAQQLCGSYYSIRSASYSSQID